MKILRTIYFANLFLVLAFSITYLAYAHTKIDVNEANQVVPTASGLSISENTPKFDHLYPSERGLDSSDDTDSRQ